MLAAPLEEIHASAASGIEIEAAPIAMTAFFFCCCLDSRHFPLFSQFINQVKQVEAAAGDTAVLLLLSFPVQHIELWKQLLVKTFSREKGYNKNVTLAFSQDIETDMPLGQAVLFLSKDTENAVLSHVAIMESPQAYGYVDFGRSMIYVEVQIGKVKKKLQEKAPQSIGILWAPDLFCVGKPYFNDANYSGAVGLMIERMVSERHRSLCALPYDASEDLPFDTALDIVKSYLAGVLLLTDMRSEFFGARYPVHKWLVNGKVHAVPGTFIHGEFRDAYANQRLGCLPVCYKVRVRSASFYVPHHSFDFEVICEGMLQRSLDNHSIVSTSVGDDESMVSTSGSETEDFVVSASSCFSTSLSDSATKSVSQSEVICEGMLRRSLDNQSSSCFSTSLSDSATESVSQSIAVSTLEHGSTPDEAEPECMVCLDRAPTVVLEKCGHLGLCGKCWKWMCKEHFNRKKKSQTRISPASLKMDKVADAKLTCPYCREITRAVHHSHYNGIVYPV